MNSKRLCVQIVAAQLTRRYQWPPPTSRRAVDWIAERTGKQTCTNAHITIIVCVCLRFQPKRYQNEIVQRGASRPRKMADTGATVRFCVFTACVHKRPGEAGGKKYSFARLFSTGLRARASRPCRQRCGL